MEFVGPRLVHKDKDIAVGYYYVVGNTSGTAGTWTGTIPDLTAYYPGLTIAYKIGVAGASTTTLNINGIGAVTCRRNTGNLTTHLAAGTVVILVYDGTYFVWADYYTSDYYNLRSSYYDLVGTDPIYAYKVVAEGSDGALYPLTLESGTGTTKTVSTKSFKLGGKIRGYANSPTISAGSLHRYYLAEVAYINASYTFNSSSGFTAGKAVYLVGTVQSDGSFKLDNSGYTAFYTQTLPTTEDGKVYIHLGTMSTTTTSLRVDVDHPIFEYKDGKLRPYAGINNATTSVNGLMSYTDKSKLDGIANNANNYVHPTTAGNKHIPSGGAANQILKYSASGTAIWADPSSGPVAPQYAVKFESDFYAKKSSSTLYQPLNFSGYSLVSGTYDYGDYDAVHPGVYLLKSSSSGTSSGYSLYYSEQNYIQAYEKIEFIARLNYLTTTTMWFGRFDNYASTSAPANGVYFYLSPTTFRGQTSSTNYTDNHMAGIVSSAWYRFIIEVNSAKNSVTFSMYEMDGDLLWSESLSATFSSDLFPLFGAKAINVMMPVTATLASIDYASYSINTALNRV